MSETQCDNDNKKKPIVKTSFFSFLIILLISLLPGVIISASLFLTAMVNDIKIQSNRNALPSTDLSQVRIEGYTLGQYVTDWQPKINYCWILSENDDRFYRNTSDTYMRVLESDSPIAVISMLYPSDNSSWSEDYGAEIWKGFTIQNTPMPSFDSVIETLGENYVTVVDWRSLRSYYAFIDRENDIELRFSFSSYDEEISRIVMLRVDNRGWMKYFKQRSHLFDDAYVEGTHIFDILEISSFSGDINFTRYEKQFLHYAWEYFIIPLYYAAWIFPLIWALYKRKSRWFIAMAVWYPPWYLFGLFTLLARQ